MKAESDAAAAARRLENLVLASPLYAQLLAQYPHWTEWLEQAENREEYRYQALIDEWQRFSSKNINHETELLDQLRRWRRLISLRIAYRSVNRIADEPSSVRELTRLAEFCIRECYTLAWKRWIERYGEPWDEQLSRPARFSVIALGKLGGEELNFSSDVDLIFLYEGDGYCRRDGEITPFVAVEFFTKLAETIIASLSAVTTCGFLFRVDARLRPEGSAGPLVRSLSALEHYYALAGQTWERLAWIKARPIAGDLALGSELLESLQDFRYPRHPPPSLLWEIAAMKHRTEREIVGDRGLDRDLKRGIGGIREIEFVAQANQLLHAGRFPFLQTHQTQTALEQLQRYDLLSAAETAALSSAYWFLRTVEHRVQMREEQQTHALPSSEGALTAIAGGLGFDSVAAFETALAMTRRQVRSSYDALLADQAEKDPEFEAWWTFLTTAQVPHVVEKKLRHWLGADPNAAEEVRLLARADMSRLITREQVMRFRDLALSLDLFMPELARPAVTLRRLARFADRYGSRGHFFATCSGHPRFLRSLALLFDRSTAIHALLCAYPEIFEEVLRPENLRLQKTPDAIDRELAAGPIERERFAPWFSLYLRAEQVRSAISELLGWTTRDDAQTALSHLADAALRQLVQRTPGLENILIVGLGKYGGEELTPGSDLDLIVLTAPQHLAATEPIWRDAVRILQTDESFGPVFAIDQRLRPYGEAGPLLVTVGALRSYHRAGSAQLWERQALTRARVISGPVELRSAWEEVIESCVYSPDLNQAGLDKIWTMRRRIEQERDVVEPPERAFKTGLGGLVDQEFLAQIFQLRAGREAPGLRSAGTVQVLAESSRLGLISPLIAEELTLNYNFVKQIEWMLRRDLNQPVSVLPRDHGVLSRWLGFGSENEFWAEYTSKLQRTRFLVHSVLFPQPSST